MPSVQNKGAFSRVGAFSCCFSWHTTKEKKKKSSRINGLFRNAHISVHVTQCIFYWRRSLFLLFSTTLLVGRNKTQRNVFSCRRTHQLCIALQFPRRCRWWACKWNLFQVLIHLTIMYLNSYPTSPCVPSHFLCVCPCWVQQRPRECRSLWNPSLLLYEAMGGHSTSLFGCCRTQRVIPNGRTSTLFLFEVVAADKICTSLKSQCSIIIMQHPKLMSCLGPFVDNS